VHAFTGTYDLGRKIHGSDALRRLSAGGAFIGEKREQVDIADPNRVYGGDEGPAIFRQVPQPADD
jgi:hypothetical protein